jgi:hypothetical protein
MSAIRVGDMSKRISKTDIFSWEEDSMNNRYLLMMQEGDVLTINAIMPLIRNEEVNAYELLANRYSTRQR